MVLKGVLEEIEAADAEDAGGTSEETAVATESATTDDQESKGAESPKVETLVFEEEVEKVDPTPEKEGEATESEPIELADNTKVKDPVSGEITTWGKIKDRQQEGNAEIQRKFQELSGMKQDIAEMRQALEAPATEEGTEEAIAEISDRLADLDSDDPVVAELRELRKDFGAQLNELQQENQSLRETVESDQDRQNREALEVTERELLEKHPVLDQEELDTAGYKYLMRVQKGEDVKYADVVEAHAAKLMKLTSGSMEAWKEKHLRPSRKEPTGEIVTENAEKISRTDFMENGLADRIAAEDKSLREQAK
jgi:hypothetical protein